MDTRLKRLLSFAMALIMVIGMMPVNTVRAEETEEAEVTETEHICAHEAVVTAPTCTEAGSKTRTCPACGETESEPISATGHSEAVREENRVERTWEATILSNSDWR